MPAPLLLIPTGIGIGLSKRAENKRQQAAANEYSKKYPLVDDLGSMEASLATAQSELRNLNAMIAKTAGAKRVKARNIGTLNKWVVIMGGHINDLKSGMNIASSQTTPAPVQPVSPPAPVPAPVQPVSAPVPEQPVSASFPVQSIAAPVSVPTVIGGGVVKPNVVSQAANVVSAPEQEMLAPTTKKGVNWLLIGGVAIGAFVIYKMIKK
jgi:hypothetical protein